MRRLALLLTFAAVFADVASVAHAGDISDRYRQSYQHEAQGKYAEALADIDGLPSTARRSYVYHLRRGWLLYLAGRHWDAIESYRAAVAVAPDAVEPRLGLMLPEAGLLLWLDVIATGQEVLHKDPHNYTALSRMAWANYSLGRFTEAAKLYRNLLRAYPSDIEMRVGLAWSLLKGGHIADARSQFDRALLIAPDHVSAQEGRVACK
jgi:tetratricopeptide (TPR) repeat protein